MEDFRSCLGLLGNPKSEVTGKIFTPILFKLVTFLTYLL